MIEKFELEPPFKLSDGRQTIGGAKDWRKAEAKINELINTVNTLEMWIFQLQEKAGLVEPDDDSPEKRRSENLANLAQQGCY